LAALAVSLGGITGDFLHYGGYFWALMGCMIAGLLALVFLDEIISHHLFAGFFRRFPRLTKGLEHLALGVKAFHSPRTGLAVVGLAASQWLLDAVNFYIVAMAFGISNVLDGFKCMVLLFSVAAAASIPGVPGGFGNFEFAVTKVAGTWGVGKDVAFAYASWVHLVSYAIVTVAGLIFVYQMGHSIGKVWAQFSKKDKGEGEGKLGS
jgi:uncharacterized protein (TIRG00374 family)